MKTLFIGSNFSGHDSAIFVIEPEQKAVFGLSTERVTRFKHDKLFAIPALEKYITNTGLDADSVEKIYFAHTFTSRKKEEYFLHEYEMSLAERSHHHAHFLGELDAARKKLQGKPLAKFLSYLTTSPGRFILRKKLQAKVLREKRVQIDVIVKKHLTRLFPNAEIIIDYFDHQKCHAISSFYTSPFENALLFSYDGWGDDLFSRAYRAKGGKISSLASSNCPKITVSKEKYPHEILGSPAGVYAYFTHLLGFKPTSEEGKVEALAAFASPASEIYQELIQLFSVNKKEKNIEIDKEKATQFFALDRIVPLVAKYSREEVAAAVQKFLEHITYQYVDFLVKDTGEKNICLSGGAAANVIMNLDIYEHITPTIHVTPAMADDGTAQGAAILSLLAHGYSEENLTWLKGEKMPYYGTAYTKEQVLAAAKDFGDQISIEDLGDNWPEKTGDLVADGKIGAIFHGKMEWGPRALGNRSIIADPSRKDFRDKINLTIKRRPAFQPFCPSILEEEADRLFETSYLNRHMTSAFRMKKEFWEALPSAIHIDGTARAQFVNETLNANYYRLIKQVKERTGFGVVINTSFNKHGRTIVETPTDAIVDFLDTDMDYVVIEGIKIVRNTTQ